MAKKRKKPINDTLIASSTKILSKRHTMLMILILFNIFHVGSVYICEDIARGDIVI